MGRPRQHDLDDLLDQARLIWARDSVSALTIRSLSEAAAVSNGAIYHAFGSRGRLVTAVWIREADAFMALLDASARRVREDGGTPVDEVVAAALAPAAYASTAPEGARVLLTVPARSLERDDADEQQAKRLRQHRRDLTTLLHQLSARLWDREDRSAVQVVKLCVVDLPNALVLAPDGADRVSTHVLELAVRGVLSAEPPAPGVGG